MCATFSDDDVGKPVERADGKVIGTVTSIESDGAYAEPAPDAVDQLLIRFDRAEPDDPFVVADDDVREISDTRVHLAPAFTRQEPDGAVTAPADGAAADDTSEATTTTDSDPAAGVGPFDTRFQLGAGIVSGLSFLLAVVFGFTGYQGGSLLGVGPELNLIDGTAGLMLLAFLGVVALVAAIYMEPGFDH